jgi:hypothetical protein
LEEVLCDVKIKDASEEEIRKAIKFCMLVVGLRAKSIDAMDKIERRVLVNFIRQNFYGHTIAEFKLAFNKAVIGELDADANPYENFSCEYVGRIMKAYRKWASIQYRESGLIQKQTLPVQLPPPNFNPMELVQTFYQEFLEGTVKAELIPARAFEIAEEKCSIHIPQSDVLKIVRQARTHVVQQYEKQKYSKEKLEKLKALPFGESCDDEYVDRYCKALALLQWFEQQKNAGITNLTETYATKNM